jgi:hypothetical protein
MECPMNGIDYVLLRRRRHHPPKYSIGFRV